MARLWPSGGHPFENESWYLRRLGSHRVSPVFPGGKSGDLNLNPHPCLPLSVRPVAPARRGRGADVDDRCHGLSPVCCRHGQFLKEIVAVISGQRGIEVL